MCVCEPDRVHLGNYERELEVRPRVSTGLTGAVLFSPVLGNGDPPVDHRLAFQNVLIVAVAGSGQVARRGPLPWPVAVALHLREHGGLVEERQVALEVKVRLQAFVRPVAKTLVILEAAGGASRTAAGALPGGGRLERGLGLGHTFRGEGGSWGTGGRMSQRVRKCSGTST